MSGSISGDSSNGKHPNSSSTDWQWIVQLLVFIMNSMTSVDVLCLNLQLDLLPTNDVVYSKWQTGLGWGQLYSPRGVALKAVHYFCGPLCVWWKPVVNTSLLVVSRRVSRRNNQMSLLRHYQDQGIKAYVVAKVTFIDSKGEWYIGELD